MFIPVTVGFVRDTTWLKSGPLTIFLYLELHEFRLNISLIICESRVTYGRSVGEAAWLQDLSVHQPSSWKPLVSGTRVRGRTCGQAVTVSSLLQCVNTDPELTNGGHSEIWLKIQV